MDHLISINSRTQAKNNTAPEITRFRFLIVFHIIFDTDRRVDLKQILYGQFKMNFQFPTTLPWVLVVLGNGGILKLVFGWNAPRPGMSSDEPDRSNLRLLF